MPAKKTASRTALGGRFGGHGFWPGCGGDHWLVSDNYRNPPVVCKDVLLCASGTCSCFSFFGSTSVCHKDDHCFFCKLVMFHVYTCTSLQSQICKMCPGS